VEKANGTVCKAQFDAYNGKCKTAFGLSSRSAPKPALVCLPTATESESAFGLRFGLLVCGGSKDGGTDASVIDGSSGDASTDAATDASSSTDASTDASPGNDDAGTDAATDGATDAGTDGATGLWAPADPRGRFVEGFRAARFRGEIEANEGEGQGR
jgi:hypothetical protein